MGLIADCSLVFQVRGKGCFGKTAMKSQIGLTDVHGNGAHRKTTGVSDQGSRSEGEALLIE